MPAGTRAQAYKRDSSGVAPASPQVADRALLERCIGRPPKKVGRIFGPRRGLRLPAWPRLGHNFANDIAVSMTSAIRRFLSSPLTPFPGALSARPDAGLAPLR